jgi:hypothetical protein
VVASLHSAAEALSHVLPSSPGSRWRWQALVDRASIDHLMVRIGPASLLAPRIKRIYDRAGFDDDVSGLRGAVASLRDQLLSRGEMLETLFQEYRAHLRRFALDPVWLIFRPDEYLGPIDFAQLERGCDRALACADDGQMRLEFISAVHRWFWLNGIDAGFVFAPNAEGSSND